MAKKEKWIAEAVSEHPGALTRKAKKAGMGVQEYAEAKQHAPGRTGKQARLGLTLNRLAKKK